MKKETKSQQNFDWFTFIGKKEFLPTLLDLLVQWNISEKNKLGTNSGAFGLQNFLLR